MTVPDDEQRRSPPTTAADAWTEWAEDYCENPANPRRGTWMALKESFFGGMVVTLAMLGHGPPQDLRTVRDRAVALQAELRQWVDSVEEVDRQDWLVRSDQRDLDNLSEWLMKQGLDYGGLRVWNLLEPSDDGGRGLPEMGFAPQLGLAIAALHAISTTVFPRTDGTDGEPKFPLHTDMSTLAAATLFLIEGPSKDKQL